MKKLILFTTLFASIFIITSCAMSYQTISFAEDEAVINVFDSLDATKNDLFVRANDWMVSTFSDATSVIEYSDKEAGTIIGKYLLSGVVKVGAYGSSVDTRVYAKIDIRVKDNKAKVTISPLGDWTYDPSGFTIYKYSKEQAKIDMNALAESLRIRLIKQDDDF